MLRVCLLGTGDYAYVHADWWGRVPGARLVAVAGRTPDRVQRLCRGRPGVEPLSMEDVQKSGRPFDLVDIVTPHSLHAEQTVRALEAGYHVLVEKPMATTAADAGRMVRAAGSAGRRLFVVSQYRFIPAFRVLSRVLGGVRVRRAKYSMKATLFSAGINTDRETWKSKRETAGGGLLIGSLVHPLDLLLKWFGAPQDIVAKTGAEIRNIEVETRVQASWRADHGARIELEGAALPGVIPAAELEIELENGRKVRVQNRRFDPRGVPIRWKLMELWTGFWGRAVPSRRDPLARQFADIVQSLATGRRAAVEGADGLSVIGAVEKIYEAALKKSDN
ncbi:MAG: hypothetical protein A3G34_06895 [Candidatus Lindowbacteria bacterium RIFCSPLOWO2_12_FULL_62_27]|nr:MAG: hypothetical protein A3G34_06895 [Candidatus Lindowbacteria bacterium RIFCSPLOWO2_12_FULL_62_27]OGH63800.1 MAG: hypothetical protein A3I06_12670 [Candidatus Lindowbacteria bacterium RIFCSPLOWO2_02_FULL_62_12]